MDDPRRCSGRNRPSRWIFKGSCAGSGRRRECGPPARVRAVVGLGRRGLSARVRAVGLGRRGLSARVRLVVFPGRRRGFGPSRVVGGGSARPRPGPSARVRPVASPGHRGLSARVQPVVGRAGYGNGLGLGTDTADRAGLIRRTTVVHMHPRDAQRRVGANDEVGTLLTCQRCPPITPTTSTGCCSGRTA
jgi:hypothetical protein